MDQGLAAVLGAAVGVAGSAITGSLGYIAARRQAPDQGRIEHARQLRTERRETYLAFMEWMKPAVDFMNLDPSECTRERYEAERQKLAGAEKQLNSLRPRVELCGPTDVAKAAGDVWLEVYELAIALERRVVGQAPNDDELSTRIDAYDVAHQKFIDTVRAVMDRVPT
ncbi:hypothetical protein ACQF36_41510 [Streptomyces sp. Marseille-Q5077]|uniref:hypothetical protein n=1 Tax=Streptomyces sp. Marseille-Q5077 TaxID=3418995 RepID=UPI003CFBC800